MGTPGSVMAFCWSKTCPAIVPSSCACDTMGIAKSVRSNDVRNHFRIQIPSFGYV